MGSAVKSIAKPIKKVAEVVKPVVKPIINPIATIQDVAASTSIGRKVVGAANQATGGFVDNVMNAQRGDIKSLVKVGQTVGGVSGMPVSFGGFQGGNMSFFDSIGDSFNKLKSNLDFGGAVNSLLGVNGNAPGSGTMPAETLLGQTHKAIAVSNQATQDQINGMSKNMMMMGGGAVALILMILLLKKR